MYGVLTLDTLLMDPELPPLQELESLRQRLIDQIAAAEQLFATENNGHELLTTKAALKCIDEVIKQVRDKDVA